MRAEHLLGPPLRDRQADDDTDRQRGRAEHEGRRVAPRCREAVGADTAGEQRADRGAAETPPTVRVTVFIPVATPVCSGPTFSMIRFAIAANASPMPLPSSAAAT